MQNSAHDLASVLIEYIQICFVSTSDDMTLSKVILEHGKMMHNRQYTLDGVDAMRYHYRARASRMRDNIFSSLK